MLRPMSSPNTGSISPRLTSTQACRLDVAGACDSETSVVFEEVSQCICRNTDDRKYCYHAGSKKNAAYRACGSPPAPSGFIAEFMRLAATAKIFVVLVVHLSRHAGQAAARDRHTRLRAPEARLRGGVILPHKGPGFVIALCHA